MTTLLTTKAPERGTYAVTTTFKDEAGVLVTPNAPLTWTLTDMLATVINSRSAIGISPASSVTVVLTDLDLAIADTYLGLERVLTFQGTYNSSLGSNRPLKAECRFYIDPLVAVS